ncbi:hypothetical protein J1605_017928 [Eschrichtius robustus]|uniref:Nudix hydrolase domain-containing protein n=1 Tax=Eschrichtius robustus TaxID=9764 RepID=A0AB34HVW9_ESCRO|nr:hypothetical protein J1605_017928 [Eschrichtius robustus]
MEPEEEPGGAAVREVYEEAGVKGKLGRLLGIFEVKMLSRAMLKLLNEHHKMYFYEIMGFQLLLCYETRKV